MSRLSERIRKIERQIKAGRRCPTCRDWATWRIVHEGLDEDLGPEPENNPPERCPDCGWEPGTITVIYTEVEREVSA